MEPSQVIPLADEGALGPQGASHACLAAETLPYREAVCDILRSERAKGRWSMLATAADRSIAESVAAHLGLFDDVVASDETHNLKGTVKLQAIRARIGNRFVYAGDSDQTTP